MKILIIDDEPGILKMYGDKFQSDGYTVVTASNGDEGITKAKTDKPDFILLDIIMPKVNGLDVLKMIKSDEAIKNIPVVTLTNLPAEMSAEKAKALGAIDYLVKAEYDPADIVAKVNQYFTQKASAPPTATPAEK